MVVVISSSIHAQSLKIMSSGERLISLSCSSMFICSFSSRFAHVLCIQFLCTLSFLLRDVFAEVLLAVLLAIVLIFNN